MIRSAPSLDALTSLMNRNPATMARFVTGTYLAAVTVTV
jgi:hypothetical protein